MNKYNKPSLVFTSVLLFCAFMNLTVTKSVYAVEVHLDNGEVIELDQGVVDECENDGLNFGACACVVSIMLEEERVNSLSLDKMISLTNEYPETYASAKARCQNLN